MKLTSLIMLALAGVSSFAHAANTRFVDPSGTTSFAISRHSPNRIAVQGDRITSFVRISGTFMQEHDDVSGDLFITPILTEDNSNTIAGFLTTEEGNTIQVFLTTKNMPSTNTELMIRLTGQDVEKARRWERSFDDLRLAANQLARDVNAGVILPGYVADRFDKGVPLRAKSLGKISAAIFGLHVGHGLMAEEIRLFNNTDTDQPLTERMLADKNVIGVWIEGAASRPQLDNDTIALHPNESIRAVRIRHNIVLK